MVKGSGKAQRIGEWKTTKNKGNSQENNGIDRREVLEQRNHPPGHRKDDIDVVSKRPTRDVQESALTNCMEPGTARMKYGISARLPATITIRS